MALAESLSDSVSRRATRRCHRPTLSRPCAGKRAAGAARCAISDIAPAAAVLLLFSRNRPSTRDISILFGRRRPPAWVNATSTLLSSVFADARNPATKPKNGARARTDCGTRTPVAVLVGGPNSAYAFTMDEFECLATHIVTLTEQNIFPMITVSRRSPPAFAAHLRARLAHATFFLGQ